MARIAGIDIPREKKISISLTYVYGIGRTFALEMLKKVNIDPERRVKDLSGEEIARINNLIARDYQVEGDLRREITQNIKRYMDIGCYRGLRHRRGLPVRGQRTHTNSRTRKGPRRTVGAQRKK